MSIKFNLFLSDEHIEERTFEEPFVSVGRSQTNMLIIDDALISRRHFVLEYLDNKWYITDQASSHGTKVNGKVLPKEKNIHLIGGETIEIGNMTIKFSYDDNPPNKEYTKIVARQIIDDIFNGKQVEENTKTEALFNDLPTSTSPFISTTPKKNVNFFLLKMATIDKIFLLLALLTFSILSIYFIDFIKNYY